MTGARSPFEDRLASALRDVRPRDLSASAGLRERALSVANPKPHWWMGRTRVAALGILGAVAFIVAVALLRMPADSLGPGAGDAPAPTIPFDPSIVGLGIVEHHLPTLWTVPPLVGLLIAGLGARWALRSGSFGSWRFAAGLLAGAGAAALALYPGFAHGSSYGPEIGYDLQVASPPGTDYPSTWYETAQPGGALMLYVTLRNDGPLPMHVDGLVETLIEETPLIPRWTAVWLGDNPNAFGSSLEHLVPFTPQTVDPGMEIQIYLVGRAGLCAYGPGYTLETPTAGLLTRSPTIEVAYSVLGLGATSEVQLPMTLVEPNREHCEPIGPNITTP